MTGALAASITRSASKQTYSTIRFLVDRPRVDDAFRAYAYFRWVDDVLDGGPAPDPDPVRGVDERAARLAFLGRQQGLLEASLRGDRPDPLDRHEAMLVDLVANDGGDDPFLRSYLVQMMRVMTFDVGRRGRLVTGQELDDYTGALAIAVTDAMHHFIGGGAGDPPEMDRYRAVRGAHILHMLRDTAEDLRAGYVNVPREVLEAGRIGPGDIGADAYRAWVRERVRQADDDLTAGAAAFARHRCRRQRLAGLAYIARFRWLVDRLERDDFLVRPSYAEAYDLPTRVRMAASVAAAMVVRPGTPAGRAPLRPLFGGRS